MMNKRLETVMMIWVAFGAASVFTFAGDSTSSNDIVLAVIFAMAAVIGTGMVMYASPDQESGAAAESRKLKNNEGALLDRLVESMSEDELEALRNRLTLKVGEDGELVTQNERATNRNRNTEAQSPETQRIDLSGSTRTGVGKCGIYPKFAIKLGIYCA